MLVLRTTEKKVFWEFDSTLMQNMSHNLLLTEGENTIRVADPHRFPPFYESRSDFHIHLLSNKSHSLRLLIEYDYIHGGVTIGHRSPARLTTRIHHRRQTATPGTTCPTLYDKCAGSFCEH